VTSGAIAALVAALALGFVEGWGRFYPARNTWRDLRRTRGRRAMRLVRERYEAAGARRPPRLLTTLLIGLVIAWVAGASLLDKRWWEVVADVVPYAIVLAALLRTPRALRAVGQRMRDFEREVGDDPDAPDPEEGDGPAAMAL
jgi:hypothetical protein